RQKLNAIDSEFKDKRVLLVDDSIVRGTTSQQIVQMAREAGAARVYFASASPPVKHPNVYGIDMPSAHELVAYNRSVEEVQEIIGADRLIFQDIEDLIQAVKKEDKSVVKRFDTAVFDGQYVTGDVSTQYLEQLELIRNDSAKRGEDSAADVVIGLHNNQ
ncbi:MAG: amidophosphoribosyltransferase, partial [Sedimenticola sp.]|nr:amidophosphoribosyltransferase [Sedimenticola sp.]